MRGVAALEFCVLGGAVTLGRLIRLAKDCELDETWSSGRNLDRCVAALLLGEVVAVVRSEVYD